MGTPMMMPTDWAALWRELASRDVQASDEGAAQMVERWRGVARKLDSGRKQDPDPLLDLILGRLTSEMTVLDVGAGIGRWTLPMAGRVRRVTAVEPLQGMRQVLVERAAAQGIANLDVLDAPWLTAEVPRHDVVVAAHATYTTTDLLGFVRKMETSARRSCFLALRVPRTTASSGAVRAHQPALARQPQLHRGVQSAALGRPPPQRPDGADRGPALDRSYPGGRRGRAKRHLHLDDDRHDGAIREVLHRRLVLADGIYRWPDGMRSALIWWDTA